MKQANHELSDHVLAQISAGLTLGGTQTGNLAGDIVDTSDSGPSVGDVTPLADPDHGAGPSKVGGSGRTLGRRFM